MIRLGFFALMATTAMGCGSVALGREAQNERLFREQVAPLLEARCLHCHNDDTSKGGLSLSRRDAAVRGGDEGPAITAGKPEESGLVDKITGDRPEMPRGEKPLSKTEVAAISGWIAAGAHWPSGRVLIDKRFASQDWWAFRALVAPAVPTPKRQGWTRTPIDAFILAKLEEQKLEPSPEADRRVLIRRLSFDLLGLPPSPALVDAFVNDDAPFAYERLVDRLLASPHYGERWGRHWLDVVHYGDTHGYDKDKRRDHAWPYRDYVVSAWNDDLPYSQFIREQLAGDVLWPGSARGMIAAGFIAAGPWDFVGNVELREGTIDKKKTRVLDRDDMVASTMGTFTSLTVHCARCHDHKFDPIPQVDYYRLQAVFAGVDRGDRDRPSPVLEARRRVLEAHRDQARRRLARLDEAAMSLTTPDLARLDLDLSALRGRLREFPPAEGPIVSRTNGYHSAIYPDPDHTAWVEVDLGATYAIDEIRLAPARPTDFADTPGFGFPPRYRVEVSDEPGMAHAARVDEESRPDQPSVADKARVIRPGGRPARYVRVTATRLWKRLDDYILALGEIEVMSGGVNRARGARVTALDSIEGGRWGREFVVDGFDSRRPRPDAGDLGARARHELLFQIQELEKSRGRLVDRLLGPSHGRERETALADLKGAVAELKASPVGEPVYTVRPIAPRPITVLRRGDVEQPGERVGPGALSCLKAQRSLFPDSVDEGRRRAALAEWIASPQNVLTWRSIANRVWHYHFGRGLVDTPNDFGRNGGRPSHPELLDWLAVQVRDQNGSLKTLHRLIVTSAVYRQQSAGDPRKAARDGDNRLLWRQNRRRLDAESVRDGVLATSGSLNRRMGGPGFELFAFKDDHSPVYDHTDPAHIDYPQARRRSVYRFVVRSVANPFMEALDCADPNINTPVRGQTLTALQALALFNDLFVARQAQEFARRLEQHPGETRDHVVAAFRATLGRDPTAAEQTALAAYAARHGLANACRLLWNTNEFNFID